MGGLAGRTWRCGGEMTSLGACPAPDHGQHVGRGHRVDLLGHLLGARVAPYWMRVTGGGCGAGMPIALCSGAADALSHRIVVSRWLVMPSPDSIHQQCTELIRLNQ